MTVTRSGGSRAAAPSAAMPAVQRARAAAQGQLVWTPPSIPTMAAAARRVGTAVLLLALPLALIVATIATMSDQGTLHFDFRGTIWEPAQAILDGDSPYPLPTREAVDVANPALYPPFAFVLALPLTPLPFTVAAALWLTALLAGVVAALAVLGVRDWRCYTVTLASLPVLLGAAFGNATLLLVPAVALAWAYRDRALVAGAAIGLAVALKLFLWPLAVWLLVTRRLRATAASVAVGGAAILVPWAAIGFDGLRAYPDLLRTADDVMAANSNSLLSAGLGLGLGSTAAHGVAIAAGVLVLGAAALLARRRDGDRRAFAAALAAALVLSPIVWPHYLALLVVPVAILRPRFDRLWLVVPATWLVYAFVPLPGGDPAGRPADVPANIWQGLHLDEPPLWKTLSYAGLVAVVLASVLRARKAAA